MSVTFVVRRLLQAIPTLIGVAIIVFVLVRVVPGDPILMMIGPGATEADIENLRRIHGLDGSIVEQFIAYVGNVLSGEFGTSISLREDVLELILGRLPVTLELAVMAIVVAVTIGLFLGVIGSYFRNTWFETVVDSIASFLVAIPDFLWALLFILFLGVLSYDLPVIGSFRFDLPITGIVDRGLGYQPATNFYLLEALFTGNVAAFLSVLEHMIQPALALALPLMAIIGRVLKNSLNEALTQDYILLARVKGFTRLRIVAREALRNALVPTVTLTGVQFTFLVGGTVLIEKIFAYPGIGNMAIDAVLARDLPLIQGLVLTFALLFIVTNLLVDMTYAVLNPRLRHG